MTGVIRWSPERARVQGNVYRSQVARMCSSFGSGPRLFPRSPAENADVLANWASMTVDGWRRLGLDEWAAVFWHRRSGPLALNKEAFRVYFATFRLLTRDE